MLKFLFQFVVYVIAIILLLYIHLGLAFLLPEPLNKVNVLVTFITLYIVVRETGAVVWLSLLLHFVLELYAVTSFGTILFPAVFATLVTYWFHRDVLTNRSWYAAATLVGIFLVLYRVGYTALASISQFVSTNTLAINYGNLIQTFLWELFWTVLFVTVIYNILVLFIKRLQKSIIYT